MKTKAATPKKGKRKSKKRAPSGVAAPALPVVDAEPVTEGLTDGLPARRARFVEEYLIDLNATQAAIRAGYSKKTAKAIGHELLTFPDVQEAIIAAKAARSRRTEVKADEVVLELAKLGFSNMLDYVRVTDGGLAAVDLSLVTRDQAAAIAELVTEEVSGGRDGDGEELPPVFKTKLKLVDKRAALVDLGKHLGVFKERIEVETISKLSDAELLSRVKDAIAEHPQERHMLPTPNAIGSAETDLDPPQDPRGKSG